MAIWLEFPPNKLTAIRTAFLGAAVDEGEAIQDSPVLDSTETRMLVGSSRITLTKAQALAAANVPWLTVHTSFPADFEEGGDPSA